MKMYSVHKAFCPLNQVFTNKKTITVTVLPPPAIIVELLLCTKTEKKITTSKPLNGMLYPGIKEDKPMVIAKTRMAYILACLLDNWGIVTNQPFTKT